MQYVCIYIYILLDWVRGRKREGAIEGDERPGVRLGGGGCGKPKP